MVSKIVSAGDYQRKIKRAREIERIEKAKRFSTKGKKLSKAERRRRRG